MSALIQFEPGGQTRGLNDKDAEIEELKEKNYALQTSYRNKARELLNCSRSLLDKDDQIDQLKRQIDNLQTLCRTIEKLQTENANLKSSVKEKDIQIVQLQKRQSVQSVQSEIKPQPENNSSLNLENESAESKLQMKQQIDNLYKLVQSLQNDIRSLHNELQIQSDENNDLKCRLKQKEAELMNSQNKCKELEEYIDENAVDLPPGGMVHEGKIIITGQVDEEMPEAELTKDIQTESDLIFLSSDEEESCESAKIKDKYEYPDSTQKPIREEEFKESTSEPMKSDSFRRNYNLIFLGINEEEELEPGEEEEVQDENATKHPPKRPYSDEEVNQIIHYIFNVYKPLKPNPSFSNAYFKSLSKKLEKDNVCERTWGGLYNSFRNFRLYDLYKNKQLQTAEHRKIVKMAFEAYDWKQVHKLIEQYDQARAPDITDEEVAQMKSLIKLVRRKNNNLEDCLESTQDLQTETDLVSLSSEEPEAQRSVQNEKSTKHLSKRPYSEEEIHQIIHYIFNVHKPIEPNPTFGVDYFRFLSEKLKEDNVCQRNEGSLVGTFRCRRVYELYKNKQLNTAEHRKIAVEAFQTFHWKESQKLIEQYDRARAPGITDEQIAEMKSLYKEKVRDDVPKTQSFYFSIKEDNKMIDLIFNQISVDLPKKRNSAVYWRQIRDEMFKHTNIKRKFLVCTTHFRRVLLPVLHKRKDLHTAEHRRIAVELYGLWWNADKKEQYIRLYDSARPSRPTQYYLLYTTNVNVNRNNST